MSYIRTSFLAEILPLLEEHGVDARKLLGSIGLDFELLMGSDKLITLDQHNQIISLVAEATHIPHIGLICAERQMIDIFGPLVFAAAKEATVGEALFVIIKYIQVLIQDFHVEISGDEKHTTFAFKIQHPSSAASRYFHEHAVSLGVKLVRIFAGSKDAVHSVYLRTTEPIDTRYYENYFHCPLYFKADFSGLKVETPLLQHWVSASVSELIRRYRLQIQERFAGDIVAQVEHVLELIANISEINLSRVASTMGVSTRTLQRKLKEANTSFQDIVDRAVCSLACQHLLQNSKILDIATILGFSDVSSFSRFFKRAMGKAPSQWHSEVVGSSCVMIPGHR